MSLVGYTIYKDGGRSAVVDFMDVGGVVECMVVRELRGKDGPSNRCRPEGATVLPVPQFPEFRPVELEDSDFLDRLLEIEQPSVSELTFANIYLWRRTYDFHVAACGGGVLVKGTERDGSSFYLPPIAIDDKVDAARTLLTGENMADTMRRVPEDMAKALEEHGFATELDRDQSDYVYRSDKLINLSGRKLHRKKNHIAQFKSKYDYEYRRVTGDLIAQCEELQTEWCDLRDCFVPENVSLAEEHEAIMEALQLLDRLKLVAGAILIDGRVVSFSIGGQLNKETLVIHFEKANPAYPGLYQVINREFCADAAAEYRFVNREQDLGEPGLRKAKESYYPDHMVNKYIISPPGL